MLFITASPLTSPSSPIFPFFFFPFFFPFSFSKPVRQERPSELEARWGFGGSIVGLLVIYAFFYADRGVN